jgi:hypothetical protein
MTGLTTVGSYAGVDPDIEKGGNLPNDMRGVNTCRVVVDTC